MPLLNADLIFSYSEEMRSNQISMRYIFLKSHFIKLLHFIQVS